MDNGTLDFNRNIIIGVVYRPPDKDIHVFTTVLYAILKTIQKENCLCYMMGDFNMNLLDVDKHVPSSEFLVCMYTMSYIPIISKPTGVTVTSATLTDNIFTNNLTINSAETCSGILYSDISDHFPVFYIDNNRCLTHANLKCITNRLYADQNIARFTKSIFNADWSKVNSELDDPNNAYAAFYSDSV